MSIHLINGLFYLNVLKFRILEFRINMILLQPMLHQSIYF